VDLREIRSSVGIEGQEPQPEIVNAGRSFEIKITNFARLFVAIKKIFKMMLISVFCVKGRNKIIFKPGFKKIEL
jgi:hypothetical protein